LALTWWKYSRQSRSGIFSHLLELVPKELGGSLDIELIDERKSVVSATVPEWGIDETDGRAKLGVIMAMYDEISTYCGVCQWDRTMRPGLSLQLTGRATGPLDVGQGDRIKIETRLLKTGKTVGFLDIVVKDTNDRVLVHGEHTKFMPTHLLFPFFLQPWQQPFIVPVIDTYLSSRPVHQVSVPKTIEEVIRFDSPEITSDTYSTATKITPNVGNPLGMTHGGAVVLMGAENALRGVRNLALQPEKQTPHVIQTSLLQSLPTTKDLSVRLETSFSEETYNSSLHSRTWMKQEDRLIASTEVWF